MPIILAALAVQAASASTPPCKAVQLRLETGPREGIADFAPRTGLLLNILNSGPDCAIAALPPIGFRDGRGRALPISRRSPPGMHPGPALLPIELHRGHHVAIEVSWTPCPASRGEPCARAGRLTVLIGSGLLETRVDSAVVGGPNGEFRFDQPPARVVEGVAET